MGGDKTGSVKTLLARFRRGAARPGRLVLHLGDFKTGTTAIQTWLGQQGAAHGIATPPGFNQAALAQSLLGGDAEAAFARVAGQLAGRDAPHLVLSAEHFEQVDPVRLADLLARHLPALAGDARAIVWVRPHPAAYLARLAESVKIGSHRGGVGDYLDRPDIPVRLDYATRLGAWAQVMGDRLSVRLYDGAMDVVRDFVTFVTGADPGPQTGLRVNATPALRDLARARALHDAIGDLPPDATGARFTIGRAFGRALAASPDAGPALTLDRATAIRLRDRLGPSADAADARFFPGAPLRAALTRAVDQAPDSVPDIDPAALLSPDVLAEIARMGAMIREGLLHPGGPARADRFWHEEAGVRG